MRLALGQGCAEIEAWPGRRAFFVRRVGDAVLLGDLEGGLCFYRVLVLQHRR